MTCVMLWRDCGEIVARGDLRGGKCAKCTCSFGEGSEITIAGWLSLAAFDRLPHERDMLIKNGPVCKQNFEERQTAQRLQTWKMNCTDLHPIRSVSTVTRSWGKGALTPLGNGQIQARHLPLAGRSWVTG